MKSISGILFSVCTTVCFVSCGLSLQSKSDNEISGDNTFVGGNMTPQQIDSILASGTCCHIESWEAGRIVDAGYKNASESTKDSHCVDFYVNKLSTSSDTLYYIELNYCPTPATNPDKQESKLVCMGELNSFYTAINEIRQHYGIYTDHYENYTYKTKSGATLSITRYINADEWTLNFCSIEMSREDLFQLESLLKQAESKVREIAGTK